MPRAVRHPPDGGITRLTTPRRYGAAKSLKIKYSVKCKATLVERLNFLLLDG